MLDDGTLDFGWQKEGQKVFNRTFYISVCSVFWWPTPTAADSSKTRTKTLFLFLFYLILNSHFMSIEMAACDLSSFWLISRGNYDQRQHSWWSSLLWSANMHSTLVHVHIIVGVHIQSVQYDRHLLRIPKKKNVNLNRHCLLYLTLYFEFTASTHHYRIAMFDEDCLYSIFWIKYFYWNRTHKIECLKTKINIWKFEQSTESHAQSVTQSSVCELMIIQSAPSWGATSKSYALYDHQAPVTHKRKYSAHHTRRRKLFAK